MFQKLLKEISSVLNAASIPYMVIGGQAVLVYGEPRLTRDIEITLGVGVDDLDKVKSAIDSLDLSILNDDEKFVRKTMVFPLRNDESGIRLDLIFSFSPYERKAIENANEIEIDGAPVKFASLEDAERRFRCSLPPLTTVVLADYVFGRWPILTSHFRTA